MDHFSYANSDTFKLRYLLADQFWAGNGAPIFLYTGNEGDITWFCNNTVSRTAGTFCSAQVGADTNDDTHNQLLWMYDLFMSTHS